MADIAEQLRISVIESGEELGRVWRESEGGGPDVEAWGTAIELGRITSLAARRAARALGYVTIRWAGPIPREQEFAKVVTEHFPELPPTAAIYGLHVHPDQRRQGVATALMGEAERRIFERSDMAKRAVLHVKADNELAISLYESLGYTILGTGENNVITVDVPAWDLEKQEWASKYAISVPMVKELHST